MTQTEAIEVAKTLNAFTLLTLALEAFERAAPTLEQTRNANADGSGARFRNLSVEERLAKFEDTARGYVEDGFEVVKRRALSRDAKVRAALKRLEGAENV